jgi:hypothetical protein
MRSAFFADGNVITENVNPLRPALRRGRAEHGPFGEQSADAGEGIGLGREAHGAAILPPNVDYPDSAENEVVWFLLRIWSAG